MSETEEKTIQTAEERTGYKKTKLGWIPEDWQIEKLGKLGTFANEKLLDMVRFILIMTMYLKIHFPLLVKKQLNQV